MLVEQCIGMEAKSAMRYGAMAVIIINTLMFYVPVSYSQVPIHQTLFGGYNQFVNSGRTTTLSIDCAVGGRIIVTGNTAEADLPVTENAIKKTITGDQDGFIAILDSTLSRPFFISYFGGSGVDALYDFHILNDSCLIVCGSTFSTDLPISNDAFQSYNKGESDAFYCIFNYITYEIIYCSYFGGEHNDAFNAICMSRNGDIYAAGVTASEGLPQVINGYQPVIKDKGGRTADGCVVAFTPDGFVRFATYLGGWSWDSIENVDVWEEDVFISGYTMSDNMPVTASALQSGYGGDMDSFYSSMSLDLRRMNNFSYLGGEDNDYIFSQSVVDGRLYLASSASETPFFTTPDALPSGQPVACGYLLELDEKWEPVFATYFGGSGMTAVYKIVASGRDIYLCGWTEIREDFPGLGDVRQYKYGSITGYISKITRSEKTRVVTYIPLPEDGSRLYGLRIYDGRLYYFGDVVADSVYTSNGAFQSMRKGFNDDVYGEITQEFLVNIAETMHYLDDLSFVIYPNPATTVLNISFANSLSGGPGVKIFNALGRLVTEIQIDEPADIHMWDLRDSLGLTVPSGVYYAVAASINGIITKKLLITR